MNEDNVIFCSTEELEKKRKEEKKRETIEAVKQWCFDNKEEILLAIPAICGLLYKGSKTIGKRVNLAEEKRLKENYVYDRSLGHYWELRRKLTNSEWAEIERRKRNGEKLADILSSMRVLK